VPEGVSKASTTLRHRYLHIPVATVRR